MIASIVILILTVLSSTLFILLLLASSRYDEYTKTLDEKEFPLKSIYGVGFILANVFKLDYKTKFANDLRQQVIILYGEKYSEFYIRVLYAQKFSFAFWFSWLPESFLALRRVRILWCSSASVF